MAHSLDGSIQGENHVHDPASLLDRLDLSIISRAWAAASMRVEGPWRLITGNGYPDSAPGQFPNRGNPHGIKKKDYSVRVPAAPAAAGRTTWMGSRDVFGISIDGVLFEGLTAEYWKGDRSSGWNYYAYYEGCTLGLDHNNAHVQPDGTYHYHGVPSGLINASAHPDAPVLVGFAADGFPVYGPRGYRDPMDASSGMADVSSSYVLKSGQRPDGPGGRYSGAFVSDFEYMPGAGDLDECNGRVGVTPEFPDGSYHYVITESFPNVPICWKGSPDRSLSKVNARGGRPGGKGPGMGRPEGKRPPPPGMGERRSFGKRDGGGGGRKRGGPCSGS